MTRTGALASLSLCIASLLSPVIVAWCRRKSTRLTAVLGGLLAALGLLFTSFASQFHQLFLSYGLVLGNKSRAARSFTFDWKLAPSAGAHRLVFSWPGTGQDWEWV
jgi:hypothetical protein